MLFRCDENFSCVSLFKYLFTLSLPCTARRHILCCPTDRFALSSSFVDTKYSVLTLSLFMRANWSLLALCFLVSHRQQAKRGLLIMAAPGFRWPVFSSEQIHHTQNLSPGQSVSYLNSYCQQSKCAEWAAFLGLTPTMNYNRFTNSHALWNKNK